MPETVDVTVNSIRVTVMRGATVAVAIADVTPACRKSVSGKPRGPLCGMGICYECRATVDGNRHQRTCQIICRPGMEIVTDE
jgi:sarcosine oxidase subunit alpha